MDIQDVAQIASDHMDEIKSCFKPGAKITLLIRFPDDAAGKYDFMMGDDDPQEAMNLIARRMAGPEVKPGERWDVGSDKS